MSLLRPFERSAHGSLLPGKSNTALLREVLLDRRLIQGDQLGPGDPGDFDHGAWHVACHLTAAAVVFSHPDHDFVWLEVSHDAKADRYFASASLRLNKNPIATFPLLSESMAQVMARSTLLGFVEGTSQGRISAREISPDPGGRFNVSSRHEYDRQPGEEHDGGKVWEHWCISRDLRPDNPWSESLLDAYVALVSWSGDLFVAAVARGRTSYSHPLQLAALVRYQFISREAAGHPFAPRAIPPSLEAEFQHADPARSLRAAEQLVWNGAAPAYHMFARRLTSFAPPASFHSAEQAIESSNPT